MCSARLSQVGTVNMNIYDDDVTLFFPAPVGISPMMSSSASVQSLSASGPGGKLVTGDLDSSLANLASNLNFGPASNRSGPPLKDNLCIALFSVDV